MSLKDRDIGTKRNIEGTYEDKGIGKRQQKPENAQSVQKPQKHIWAKLS